MTTENKPQTQTPPSTPVPASPSLLTPKPATLPTKNNKPSLPTNNLKSLPGTTKPKKNKLIIGLALGVISIVLIILAYIAISKSNSTTRPSSDPRLRPTATPIPRPTLAQTVPGKPSAYAQDPQILQLEAAIKSLNAQMEADNLTEPEIQPPILEINIKF